MPASLPDLSKIEKNLQKRQKRYTSQLKRTSHRAKKLLEKNKITNKVLRDRSAQLLAAAGLTGALIFSPLQQTLGADNPTQISTQQTLHESLASDLAPLTPHYPTKLSEEDAAKVSEVIKKETGITATPYLDGQSLNHNVGYTGYEQHLQRFPGDTIALHDEEQVAGIAPGLGAWGYFAPSKDEFTTEDYMREKYYSVAQTLYLPNWNTDFRYLRDWYKYRKVLLVNPTNGQAVVTALADAGPAEWTGKQFGASPEAMKELDLHKGPRKGLVIFFFVDDPENRIPLGPVNHRLNIN